MCVLRVCVRVCAATASRDKKAPKAALAPEQTVDGNEPPNKILFVQNLPDATTDAMLGMLFQQYVTLALHCAAWFSGGTNRTHLKSGVISNFSPSPPCVVL